MAQQKGRPRKQEGERRTNQLPPVRVTDAELAHLENAASASGVSVTEYRRDLYLSGGKPKRAKKSQPLIKLLSQLLVELNRIGNNLNQIARQINRGRDHDPHHLDGVLKELMDVVIKIGRRL